MTKDYTVYAGTAKLIKELLAIGGWGNEIIDVYNAGKLIETLPDPAGDTKEQLLASITVTFTDKQVNTIIKAFTHHAQKGIILPSVYALQAIEVLELNK
jgi:hypothetical protein